MRIRFMEGRAIAFLKNALSNTSNREERRTCKKVCELFANETNERLINYLKDNGFESPLKDTRFDCEPLSLDPNPIGSGELANVKAIQDGLANISPAIASSEKFWTGLCVDQAWNYVRKRWKIAEKLTGENILEHYFFGFGPRRSLTRNALSRLWWIGRLTKDEANDIAPYHATQFVLDKLDRASQILERNTSDNKRIVLETVKGLLSAEEEGFVIDRDDIRKLAIYINIVGGVELLDELPAGAISEKVLARARRICKQKAP